MNAKRNHIEDKTICIFIPIMPLLIEIDKKYRLIRKRSLAKTWAWIIFIIDPFAKKESLKKLNTKTDATQRYANDKLRRYSEEI